ncbi:hypothetical protein EVAR_34274_1 [Eumeta japonica]|uniref:Reverse transcriptase domain-containing protein n=1 Tax=Eumeta variegata TaxID=151549 RepID=A0A4C1VW13_EUMVA|nr:hypothetical protein EVAR_34274_1 [Eumeta japonica]
MPRTGILFWAWKVATIKVIPKPKKDDYARPKSYRPIGVVPVLGQKREKNANRAPLLTLDAEAAGDSLCDTLEGSPQGETSKDCIPGSIAGPTFWNLNLDSLFQELGKLGVYAKAFPDDVVFMFSEQSATTIEDDARVTVL